MIRRPRVAWLIDSREPTGASIMALRRMQVLRHRQAGTALALTGRPAAPRRSALHAALAASGLAGEVRIARADVVVTTSERTLASAAPRVTGGRLVHFVHTRPEIALASDQFMKRLPVISRVVVPAATDPGWFAARTGLHRTQVLATDDFTLPSESLLGTARPRMILAAGRLGEHSTVLDLAEGFRRALPRLRGWQLRIAGGGPGRPALQNWVDRHGLATRVLVLGPRHDLAAHYLEAGLVVRLERDDANGLSVLEALAAGVPVLASDQVPAAVRHVRHEANGWLMGRCDPAAIAAALEQLADDDLRAALAADAREHPTGLLTDADRFALHDLFDDVLDSTPADRPALRRALAGAADDEGTSE